MNKDDFQNALLILEKEKNISKETLVDVIESSIALACKTHYHDADNVVVKVDPDTFEYHAFLNKLVVKEVLDPIFEISLAEARVSDPNIQEEDEVLVEVDSTDFSRIAINSAKSVLLQKIKEDERKVIYEELKSKEHSLVTGVVQRYIGKNISINLGRTDAILAENEQIKLPVGAGEEGGKNRRYRVEPLHPNDRVKVYIIEVKDSQKGARVRVSRTHPELVRCLFEEEVSEIRDGIVEIMSIAREPGNRTKIAVASTREDVDPVGACVGMNGSRVNAITSELWNEKIDIIEWNENPAMLIENALSPAKVISVMADDDEKTAKVVVPDYQLSLAIGKEGQNARLAARLTGFKIDIKSETQARESGDFLEYEDYDEGYYDENGEYYGDGEYYEEGESYYDENGNLLPEYAEEVEAKESANVESAEDGTGEN
ncbi:MAG: transcription termination/antitermination protein NusA [Lachnospiraceae bacterium]|nr:transcription termination/antitermination protein NusA [Lachnospiraceae bacterium]